MKVTLQVDGVEMTFPKEEVPFEVNPIAIKRSCFQMKRKDSKQEAMRQIILEAIGEVQKNPARYGKTFWTLLPEKTWVTKTVSEFIKLAKERGDHLANWVEQALEWAQRIQNGETWKAICNEPDTVKWYRLVMWKYGYCRLVGGSLYLNHSACYIQHYDYTTGIDIYHTVPLIVLYK